MKVSFACAAASAIGAVALATAPVAAAGPEEDFLTIIGNEGVVWEPADTSAVLDTGHAVCTDSSNGATLPTRWPISSASPTGPTIRPASSSVR